MLEGVLGAQMESKKEGTKMGTALKKKEDEKSEGTGVKNIERSDWGEEE